MVVALTAAEENVAALSGITKTGERWHCPLSRRHNLDTGISTINNRNNNKLILKKRDVDMRTDT